MSTRHAFLALLLSVPACVERRPADEIGTGGGASADGVGGSGSTGTGGVDSGGGSSSACVTGDDREVHCSEPGPRTLQAQSCVDGAWQNDGDCTCPADTTYDPLADGCFVAVDCDEAAEPFGGGEGTEEAPYLICSLAHLRAVTAHADAHHALAASLDLSSAGAGATGALLGSFLGVFDGKGRALSGLVLEFTDEYDEHDFVGLFSTVDGVVRDLTLVNFTIEGNDYVGALAGLQQGAVERVSVKGGTMTGANEVGGLVGKNSAGISDSSSTSAVVGASSVGGLVGVNGSGASLSRSFAGGTTSGVSAVGGLVGYNYGGAAIDQCFATGLVLGNGSLGGLVGASTNSATITQSFSSGPVTGTDNSTNYQVGGLVGYCASSAIIDESYASGQVTATGVSSGSLVGHNSALVTNSFAPEGTLAIVGSGAVDASCALLSSYEFAEETTFTDVGWDLAEVWQMSAEAPVVPTLRWFTE